MRSTKITSITKNPKSRPSLGLFKDSVDNKIKVFDERGNIEEISTDLSSYLTTANAATTYQPLSGMASYLTTANAATTYQPKANKYIYPTTIELTTSIAANEILFSEVTIEAGAATCGTFQINFTGGGSWAGTGSYRVAVNTTAIASSYNSVLNISLDFSAESRSIIPINQAASGGGGFSVILRNVGTSTSTQTFITVNWSIIN